MKLLDLCALTYRLRWAGQRSEEDAHRNALDVLSKLGVGTAVSAISAARIQDLIDSFLGDGLAPSTVNRKLSALSSMLSVAEERGAIKVRPRWKSLKEPPRRDRILSDAEVDATVELMDTQSGAGYARLTRFLAETGCRVGEALKLAWGDVRENWTAVTFRAPKNGQTRTVPLTSAAQTALGSKGAGGGPFYGSTGSKFNKAWAKARTVLGLQGDKGFVPHALRHTCATKLVSRGVPLPQVMRWLGHTDIKSTMRYEHARTGELEQAREVLER